MKFILNALMKTSLFFVGMMLMMPDFSEAKVKVLIVYFSQTGHTKAIAEDIKEELKNIEVDVEEIKSVKEYPSDKDELRKIAKEESENDTYRPEFKDINRNVQSYDLILVGSPVWWGKAPKIVLSVLETYNFSGKRVRHFVTHGGDPKDTVKEMEEACKNEISESNILVHYKWLEDDREKYNKTFKAWIEAIKTELRWIEKAELREQKRTKEIKAYPRVGKKTESRKQKGIKEIKGRFGFSKKTEQLKQKRVKEIRTELGLNKAETMSD